MSRKCSKCGRGPKKSASRSHSKIKTLRTQKVNLQKMNGKKMCASCIRTAVKKSA